MKMEDYKTQCKDLQEKVDKVFGELRNFTTPDLANTEWYVNQVERLAESLGQLHQIQSEYRRLQAEQYGLMVPEDQPERIPDFDPSKYQKEEETVEVQSDPAAEIATAMAGVGALISLFRKARR